VKRTILLFLVLLINSCIFVPTTDFPSKTSAVKIVISKTPIRTRTPRPTRTIVPSRTPTRTITPTPTLTASLTSTLLPQLIAHKWQPKSVLVKLESGGGDGCCVYSYPPAFVLYANGRLIVNRRFEENGEERTQLLTKVFPRQELCSVLNTIDQTGYLYYDPSSYHPQSGEYFAVDGASHLNIIGLTQKSFELSVI